MQKAEGRIWERSAFCILTSAFKRRRGGGTPRHLILGLGSGLYLSRILAERGTMPRSWLMVLGLGLACVALTIALLTQVRRLRLYLWPLAFCFGYVLYPRPYPPLALAVGLVVFWGLTIANAARLSIFRGVAKESVWVEVFVFLGGVALYVCTLAPTLLPADAGEFQLVATLLGVAHPPGYPLYTLLGKLFTFIPLGDLAYRVNLFSAVLGALTLALVSWTVRQLTPSPWPGLAASLALGGAATFWAQATTASIRGLTALFTALILGLSLAYGRMREQNPSGRHERAQSYLTALGLALGLGVSHHGSLGFLVLPVGAYLISVDRTLITRPQQLLRPFAAAILSLSVLLYLPLRDAMGAPMAPGDLATLDGFTEHVLAQGFRGDMFAFARPDLLTNRLVVLKDILVMQFGVPLLLAMLIGGVVLLWRGSRRAFVLIAGALLVNGFVGLTYRAPQTVEYLMPAYVCLVLILGGGLGAILSLPVARLTSSVLALLLALIIYLGTAQVMAHYPSFSLLHGDHSARTYAQEILRSAPPQATILANWHYFTPLCYLQMVEGQRPDVTIRYVYPRGSSSLPDLWLGEIDRHIQERDSGTRPVIVTNFFPQFETSSYRFRPLGEAFLVVGSAESSVGAHADLGTDPTERGDMDAPPYTKLGVILGDKVELIGYRLEDADQLDRTVIGVHQPLVLHLAWRPLSPLEQDYSFFVHLVGEGDADRPSDQTPIAQADTRHTAGRYRPGEVWVDRYTLFLRPTTLPGEYALVAGAYIPLADGGWKRLTTPVGADHVALTQVGVQPSTWSPVTLHPQHQPYAGGITLVGVDYDSVWSEVDQRYPRSRRIYLHWHLRGQTPAVEVRLLFQGQLKGQIQLPGNSSQSAYLSTASDIPPEVSSLEIQVRRVGGGESLNVLGPWYLPREGESPLPPFRPDDRYISLGGKMALIGTDIDPGAPITLRMDFVALWPLTHDYTLSLRLRDTQGRWEAQEDGTPAQGAIPTMKWIRGTRVTDVQQISPPDDVVLDRARLELVVYEAFTLATLPPLDERLQAQGPLIPLGEISVSSAVGGKAR